MNKLKYLALTAIIILAGCSNATSNDSMSDNISVDNGSSDSTQQVVSAEGSIDVKDSYVDSGQAVEVLKNVPNLTVSDDFFIYTPQNLDSVSIFDLQYENSADSKTFYEDFTGLFSYIFPNETIDDEYLKYDGRNEQGERVNETVKSSIDTILSGEKEIYNMFYKNDSIAMEFTSPICGVLARFNRGKMASMAGLDVSTLFHAEENFSTEGIYSPDSTESFKLLDKEMPINQAVGFFENYINNLPYQRNNGLVNTVVERVEVLKLDSENFGYHFLTTREYGGIMFDRTNSGEVRRTNSKSEGYSHDLSIGDMIQSDEVEYVNGIERSNIIQNETKYDKIIPFETAIKDVRESLTDKVNFEIKDAELVYCSKSPDTTYSSVEGVIFHIIPSWKFKLYNPDDNFDYVCYIDAVDGGNIRYYTVGGQEW